jgi:hypothetical protein
LGKVETALFQLKGNTHANITYAICAYKLLQRPKVPVQTCSRALKKIAIKNQMSHKRQRMFLHRGEAPQGVASAAIARKKLQTLRRDMFIVCWGSYRPRDRNDKNQREQSKTAKEERVHSYKAGVLRQTQL